MRRFILFVCVVAVGMPLFSAYAQSSDRVRKSDLKKHSFVASNLRLTVLLFRPHLRDPLTFVRSAGQIQISVENGSAQAIEYAPSRLSLVGSDDQQVNLRGRMQTGVFIAADDVDRLDALQTRMIAPKAKLKEFYQLTGPVRLPARLYYGDQELAVITD